MRALLAAALLVGVAHADVATPTQAPTRLPAASVPRVLLDEWRKSENRANCAPVWFDDVPANVRIRARYFAGGWGVTVRNPQRWGIAGAGVIAEPSDLEKWKFHRETAVGIRAGYGLEGFDMGPDWLAYIHVPGQTCMYNLWSSVGKAQLEARIDHLRVVDVW